MCVLECAERSFQHSMTFIARPKRPLFPAIVETRMSVLPLGITDSDFCSLGISLLLDTNRTTVQVTFPANSKEQIRGFEILEIAM